MRYMCVAFDSAVARVCVCYSGVSQVCVYMMLDNTTSTLRAMLAKKKNGYSFVCLFNLLDLFNIMASMPESIPVYKKARTRPSH